MNPQNIALLALKRVVPRLSKPRFYTNLIGGSTDANSIPTQLSPPQDSEETTYQGTKEELEEAIEGSNDVLMMAHTALTLFRDRVVVDRAKLTITRRNFINSSEIMSIRLEDVLNVTATVGPFFGNIKIMTRILNSKPYTIGRFSRADALKLKRITQGYVIALQRDIDCNTIPTSELINLLDQLGEDEHDERTVE